MSNKVEYSNWGGCNRVAFYCPGCGECHALPVDGAKQPIWGWNGSLEKPTLTPSIRTSGFRAIRDENGQPIMDGKNLKGKNFVCHSFLREGRIEFLSDCTHELAGKTIDLPDIEEG